MKFFQFFSQENILLIIVATLIIKFLSPLMNCWGEKFVEYINCRIAHIPQLLNKIISRIISFLFLLIVISLTFYLIYLIPKNTFNFGDNTYIKRDKKTHELTIYTEGIPQVSFTKDGLKVNKNLRVTGDLYITDYFIDARDISPDTVLNILRSHKGVTDLKKDIAKETSKEVIDSLKTEGIIKTPVK